MDGVDVDVTALQMATFGCTERPPPVQHPTVVERHQLASPQGDFDSE